MIYIYINWNDLTVLSFQILENNFYLKEKVR